MEREREAAGMSNNSIRHHIRLVLPLDLLRKDGSDESCTTGPYSEDREFLRGKEMLSDSSTLAEGALYFGVSLFPSAYVRKKHQQPE